MSRRSSQVESDDDGGVEPVYLIEDPNRHGKTLAATVAAAIERDVVARGWPVGEVIASEHELLRRYGVSVPVLRQAVGVLESHQVARMRRGPGGGLVVTAPSESSVAASVSLFLEHLNVPRDEVASARAPIEVACVQLATEQLDETGIARLRNLVASELDRYATGDVAAMRELHVVIAELGGNRVLELFVKTLMTLSRHRFPGDRTPTAKEQAALERSHEDHEAIVEAMVGGDAALARHRMLRHLAEIETD